MSQYPFHSPESAPEAAAPILEKARASLGFVPNLYAGLANAPAALEAYIALSGFFDKTSLSGSSSFRVEPNSHNDSWSSSPVGMCAGRWPACAHVHEACLIRRMSPWALP